MKALALKEIKDFGTGLMKLYPMYADLSKEKGILMNLVEKSSEAIRRWEASEGDA